MKNSNTAKVFSFRAVSCIARAKAASRVKNGAVIGVYSADANALAELAVVLNETGDFSPETDTFTDPKGAWAIKLEVRR